MANKISKISTNTLIKLQDSSVGIIDFLVNYGDENKTPCPRNYVNGNLFSGTGNTKQYIYSNQESVVGSLFSNKWYATNQTWSKFCKNSFPVELSDLTKLSSSNKLANWNDFKNIVINSFIPLTNIRYCEITVTKISNGEVNLSDKKYYNIFLTNNSILGNHTKFKDLFMNNTCEDGKTVITKISDFIEYGGIGKELDAISESAGNPNPDINAMKGKVIKSGWAEKLDDLPITESLNRLLLLCVKALNKIRTDLSCTFTDDMYNFNFEMQDTAKYTSLNGKKSVYVSLSDTKYKAPAFSKSVLGIDPNKVTLKDKYRDTHIAWYIVRKNKRKKIIDREYSAGDFINFKTFYEQKTYLPKDLTVRPRISYAVVKQQPSVSKYYNATTIVNGSNSGTTLDNTVDKISDFKKLSEIDDLNGDPYDPYSLVVGLCFNHSVPRHDSDDKRAVQWVDTAGTTHDGYCTNSERTYHGTFSFNGIKPDGSVKNNSWTWSDRMGDNRGSDDGTEVIVFQPSHSTFYNIWTNETIKAKIISQLGLGDEDACECMPSDNKFNSGSISGLTISTSMTTRGHKCPRDGTNKSRGCPGNSKADNFADSLNSVSFGNTDKGAHWNFSFVAVINPKDSIEYVLEYL